MRIILTFFILLSISITLQAQHGTKVQNLDLSGSIGPRQETVAFAYVYNWQLGKKGKFEIGTGARFTSYFGSNQYYVTAPAKITSGKTGPGVLFAENIIGNLDSILFNNAQANALNITFNLGYNITPKLYASFNIDAIGFSFGASMPGTYFNGTSSAPVTAKPTGFNILLIGNNDRGSLNSEFSVRYKLNKQWGIKGGYQFLFTEYTTSTQVQTFPEKNDRFRNKSSSFLLGVTYDLNNKKQEL